MRTLAIVKQDSCIYWQRTGVNEEGESLFADPIIIRCRWDIVNANLQSEDVIATETFSNTLYPDRVLVVGSFVYYGGQDVLETLSEYERKNPKLLKGAREIKEQSTIYELRWKQVIKPGLQSDHLVIECHV